MLLSKVCSHVLASFIHGVLQNSDALFFQALALFRCWWHLHVRQRQLGKAGELPSLVGSTHSRDLHISVPARTLLCSQETCSGNRGCQVLDT